MKRHNELNTVVSNFKLLSHHILRNEIVLDLFLWMANSDYAATCTLYRLSNTKLENCQKTWRSSPHQLCWIELYKILILANWTNLRLRLHEIFQISDWKFSKKLSNWPSRRSVVGVEGSGHIITISLNYQNFNSQRAIESINQFNISKL